MSIPGVGCGGSTYGRSYNVVGHGSQKENTCGSVKTSTTSPIRDSLNISKKANEIVQAKEVYSAGQEANFLKEEVQPTPAPEPLVPLAIPLAIDIPSIQSDSPSIWGSDGMMLKLLGVEMLPNHTTAESIQRSLQTETALLQDEIASAFRAAGISMHVMDRLSIDVDENGELILGGLKDKATLAKIEQLLGQKEGLGEQLKSLAAKKSVLNALKEADLDMGAFQKIMERPENEAVRQQLVKDYLKTNNVEFDDLIIQDGGIYGKASSALNFLAEQLPGLQEELVDLFDTTKPRQKAEVDPELAAKIAESAAEKPPLFVFQNNRLLDQNVTSESDLAARATMLLGLRVEHPDAVDEDGRMKLAEAIADWNADNADYPEYQIKDFTITIAPDGYHRIGDINAKSGTGSAEGNASIARVLNSWLEPKVFSGFGADVLETHQAHHGDVEDYRHDVVLQYEGGKMTHSVVSDEADAAALNDIAERTEKISADLTSFFHESFLAAGGDKSALTAFTINVDDKGMLTADSGHVDPQYSLLIRDTLKALNERLESDDPFATEGFMTKLDPKLEGALRELVGLQSDLKRIHDPQKRAAAIGIGAWR